MVCNSFRVTKVKEETSTKSRHRRFDFQSLVLEIGRVCRSSPFFYGAGDGACGKAHRVWTKAEGQKSNSRYVFWLLRMRMSAGLEAL